MTSPDVFSSQDHQFMADAMACARSARFSADPNPHVGCVIIRNGVCVGRGATQAVGGPHAEIMALRQAGSAAKGSIAYVTLEPCAHHGKTGPCCVALADAGLSEVVVATLDPNPQVSGGGVRYLRDKGISVRVGLMGTEARALNRGFISRFEKKRPFVRCKMAMSLDGKTALANGVSQWITGPEARRDVQMMRAASSVVLAGIGTVLADDPSLNVRLSSKDLGMTTEVRQPVRVVLDSNLEISPETKLLHLPGHTKIYTLAQNQGVYVGENVEVKYQFAATGHRLDLEQVLYVHTSHWISLETKTYKVFQIFFQMKENKDLLELLIKEFCASWPKEEFQLLEVIKEQSFLLL